MKKRWYDSDPAMSMAVSLLSNAPLESQAETASHILNLLKHDKVIGPQKGWQFCRIEEFFNLSRRQNLHADAAKLLEVLKVLPIAVQLEMAMNIINHIYLLDSHRAAQPAQQALAS